MSFFLYIYCEDEGSKRGINDADHYNLMSHTQKSMWNDAQQIFDMGKHMDDMLRINGPAAQCMHAALCMCVCVIQDE